MEKYKPKTRNFEVKLESIDPTGIVIKSEELSMIIVDDQESMINNDRLFVHLGECLYRVDKKGFIIERIIPHENNTVEPKMEGFLEKKEEGWFVKWSDLHSFGHGWHWMYTPLNKDEIIDENKLKHGDKVRFSFVTTGYDEENFTPFRYVKLLK